MRRAAQIAAMLLAIVVAPAMAVAADAGPRGTDAAPRGSDAGGRPPHGACRASADVAFLVSPRTPTPGTALRVLVATPTARDATLTIEDGDGRVLVESRQRRGATPSWWTVETTAPARGTYRARLTTAGGADGGACHAFDVGGGARRTSGGGAWPIERAWDHGTELLYSAWIEHLFDDPLEAEPSWQHLDPIFSDRARNLLYDHLGLDEDAPRRLRLEPDCADLPYFLRAYFAWKLGLPFGYSDCTRGGGGSAPHCPKWHSSREGSGRGGDEVGRIGEFLRHDVGDTIHSGSARTLGNDERTDLYPVRLTPDAIRPGTVYADPYGHTLVVVQRLPQTAERGGILLAVDAQPDGTIARKRYWRGNFLFAVDPALGGAGFKHFRPVVAEGGRLQPLSNREIAADRDYGDFSLEQYSGDADDFYDRMDDLLSPTPMDPARVLRETIDALEEQVRTRVKSVANGEEYVAAHPGTIAMPNGAAIFETNGAWEDYATPSRDLRILIAIDVVRGFPARVARRPQRYAIGDGKAVADVRAELERVIRDETGSRRFAYDRSDGSQSTLTLADVLARTEGLEMAYNPNDCVETRWAAPRGSDEASTCRRHAPADQVSRMQEYRAWFHERRRPPRD